MPSLSRGTHGAPTGLLAREKVADVIARMAYTCGGLATHVAVRRQHHYVVSLQ